MCCSQEVAEKRQKGNIVWYERVGNSQYGVSEHMNLQFIILMKNEKSLSFN
jgi:hypothetical protein